MKSPKAKQGVLLALFILTALSFVSCTATKQPNTAATTDVQLTAAAETSATPTTAIQITTQVATQEPSTTASMETTEAEMPTESPTYESYVGTWSNTDDPMMGGMGIQFRAFDGNIAYFKISSHTRNASRTASVMEEIVAEVHDNQINFADYDNDADGYLDLVYMVYAGKGEADGGAADTIWPHQWEISNAGYYGNNAVVLDGKTIDKYQTSNKFYKSHTHSNNKNMDDNINRLVTYPKW